MLNPQYNLAVFGHSKHGKSTVGGRLLYEYDSFTESEMLQFEELAKQGNKDFNKFNLLFLKRNTAVWHDDGIGDISRTTFPEIGRSVLDNDSVVTFIDTPGHEDYISNMIYGAFLADAAVIVISVLDGVARGTIEAIKLLSGFNIPILGFLVAKMDMTNYSKESYQKVLNRLEDTIFNILGDAFHFNKDKCIPISALYGEGISSFTDIDWFNGQTLKKFIESDLVPIEYSQEPDVRLVVQGNKSVYSVSGAGTVIVGTLEFGQLKKNDILIMQPASSFEFKEVKLKIRNIRYARSVSPQFPEEEIDLDQVNARSIISILVSGMSFDQINKYLRRGGVLAKSNIRVANRILAHVWFFSQENLYSGSECLVHSNASHSQARIQMVVNQFTGDVIDLTQGIDLELTFANPLFIESEFKYNRLRRLVLRNDNVVIGYGICKQILE
jgi:small GTP-binding protein